MLVEIIVPNSFKTIYPILILKTRHFFKNKAFCCYSTALEYDKKYYVVIRRYNIRIYLNCKSQNVISEIENYLNYLFRGCCIGLKKTDKGIFHLKDVNIIYI